jgi:urease gamma subunit
MISTKQSVSVCLIILVFLLCLHIKSCYVEIHMKKKISNNQIRNNRNNRNNRNKRNKRNNRPVKVNNVPEEVNNIPEEVKNVVKEANSLAEEATNVVDEETNVVEVNDVFDESNNVLDDSVYDKALGDELKTKIPYWLFNVQPKGPIDNDSPINPYNSESNLGEVNFETDDSDSDSE